MRETARDSARVLRCAGRDGDRGVGVRCVRVPGLASGTLQGELEEEKESLFFEVQVAGLRVWPGFFYACMISVILLEVLASTLLSQGSEHFPRDMHKGYPDRSGQGREDPVDLNEPGTPFGQVGRVVDGRGGIR